MIGYSWRIYKVIHSCSRREVYVWCYRSQHYPSKSPPAIPFPIPPSPSCPGKGITSLESNSEFLVSGISSSTQNPLEPPLLCVWKYMFDDVFLSLATKAFFLVLPFSFIAKNHAKRVSWEMHELNIECSVSVWVGTPSRPNWKPVFMLNFFIRFKRFIYYWYF